MPVFILGVAMGETPNFFNDPFSQKEWGYFTNEKREHIKIEEKCSAFHY